MTLDAHRFLGGLQRLSVAAQLALKEAEIRERSGQITAIGRVGLGQLAPDPEAFLHRAEPLLRAPELA
ncbi:MAG: hypothetical protein ACK52U_10705, partial [Synechococcaceae cyanobacterium]